MKKCYLILQLYQLSTICFTYGENCPGPLRYYRDLGCKPVYYKEGYLCAFKYDCDHLKYRLPNRCYVNGHEYRLTQTLKKEDANPCDINCTCQMGFGGFASFSCAVGCFIIPPKPRCYQRKIASECCRSPEDICPETPEERPTCIVDGTSYKDGEEFLVNDEPDKRCACAPEYVGINIEPFCVTPKRSFCDPYFHDRYPVEYNCAPVYLSNQSPQTDCNPYFRCQNSNDTIVHHGDGLSNVIENRIPILSTILHVAEALLPNDLVCYFGNLVMHLGDELNPSVGVRCVCEVPPTPTCQRLR